MAMACSGLAFAEPLGAALSGVIALLYHDEVGHRLMDVEVRSAAARLERLEA